MRTNADLTWYAKSVDPSARSEIYTRSQIKSVTWEDRKAANVLRSGMLEADAVTVYIPMARGTFAFKSGDILVRGLLSDEITGSYTITSLKAEYRAVTVRSVDTMQAGTPFMWHYQIGAG